MQTFLSVEQDVFRLIHAKFYTLEVKFGKFTQYLLMIYMCTFFNTLYTSFTLILHFCPIIHMFCTQVTLILHISLDLQMYYTFFTL